MMKDAILKILSNNPHGAYIRKRGKPLWSPFFWPDAEVKWLERELEYIIKNTQNERFQYVVRYLRYKIREFLWKLYKNREPTPNEIERESDLFIQSLQVKLIPYNVIWSICNLQPPKELLAVDKVTIGKLEYLCDVDTQAEIHKRLNRLNREIATWSRVTVDAPKIRLAEEAAKAEINEALNLLSSAMPRHRSDLGDFHGLHVGEDVFVTDEQGRILNSRWIRSDQNVVQVSFPPEVWNEDRHDRWKAPPRPWELFPDSSPIRIHLRNAYHRFGQAVRNQDNPDVCFCFAISAIEALLEKGERGRGGREIVGVFLILASIEGRTAIPSPVKIVNYYRIRNEILHEGETLGWTSRDTTGMLWDIYTILDVLADIAIRSKARDLMDLIGALKTKSNLDQVKIAIEREMDELHKLRNTVFANWTKGKLTELFDEWKSYKRALEKINKSK